MRQYAGVTDFTEQREKKRYRPETGWTRVRSWRGKSVGADDFINTILNVTYAGYLTAEVVDDGDWAIVSADFSWDPATTGQQAPTSPDPISRVWESETNEEELPSWALPWVAKLVRELPSSEVQKIHIDMDKMLNGQFEEGETPESWKYKEIHMLYVLLAQELNTFLSKKVTLIKTEVVLPNSNFKAVHDGVNRLYDYNSLIAAEPTLPAAELIQAAGLTKHMFMKHGPRVSQTGRGRWQVVQAYTAMYTAHPWQYKLSNDNSDEEATPATVIQTAGGQIDLLQ